MTCLGAMCTHGLETGAAHGGACGAREGGSATVLDGWEWHDG